MLLLPKSEEMWAVFYFCYFLPPVFQDKRHYMLVVPAQTDESESHGSRLAFLPVSEVSQLYKIHRCLS